MNEEKVGSGDAKDVLLRAALWSAVGGWTVLLAVRYFSWWLVTYLWILSLGVLLLAVGGALAATVTAAAMAWRRGRQAVSVTVVAVMVALVVLVAPGPVWNRVYAITWYQVNRAAFAEVEELARAGELGPSLASDFYGAELPRRYRHLSVNGRVAVVGSDGRGQPVLFVPVWIGTPDDAGGFVHLESPPDGELRLDLFGRFDGPNFHLGDGWYWA